MARRSSSHPTEVELEILQILWEEGPSTVRDVHNRLNTDKQTQYSTTVKMLLVMLEKGLVKRDDSIRPQIYQAVPKQKQVQKRLLQDLIQKAYDGSAKNLLLQAISSAKSSKEDLEEIRNLIDEMTD